MSLNSYDIQIERNIAKKRDFVRDYKTDKTSKFNTKYLIEIYHHACGVNSTYIQIKFKTTILKSSDYSDANILVKRTITIAEAGTNAAAT